MSDFKIVPLETSDSVIIGKIWRIKKRGDALYVLVDNDRNRLLKFSLSGDFEREIVHKGPGPNEVLEISDYEVRGNDIYILTTGRLIVKNHVTGEVIKEIAVPAYVGWDGRLRDTESDLLVISATPHEGDNTILAIDVENGQIKSEFFPADKDWSLQSLCPELIELEKGKYIHQYGQSTDLVVIDPIHQTVDSLQLVRSRDAIGAEDYRENNKNSGGNRDLAVVAYDGLADSDSHMFWLGMQAQKENAMTLYLYDKKTKSTIAIPYDKLNDDLSWEKEMMQNQLIGVLPFNQSDDNAFISHLDPAMLNDAIEGKRLKFEDAYKVLDKVGEDANPLIVFLEFKPIHN